VLAGSGHGGGVNDNFGGVQQPAVAVGSGGAPFVAWADGYRGIYARTWNGSQWVDFGGAELIYSSQNATAPSIALTPDNRPVVAWMEQVTGAGQPFEVKLLRWSGTSWDALGGDPAVSGYVDGISESPAVAVDPSGNPIVVWDDDINTATRRLFLKQWNGAAWVELGGSATAGGISGGVSNASHGALALDSTGNPTVAWCKDVGGGVLLRQWNPAGPSWDEVAGSATGTGLSPGAGDWPSITVDASGKPTVAWQEGADAAGVIYLKRWNGSAWVELGGSATGTGLSASASPCTRPTLTEDASGNPIVLFEEEIYTGYGHIHARHWTGSTWEDWGVPPGNPYGRDSLTRASAIAFGSSGPATAVWSDGGSVFLRTTTGSVWNELGTTTPNAGGLSQTPDSVSMFPGLDMDASGNPYVAWLEQTPSSGLRIYARYWDGSAWSELGGSASGTGISSSASYTFNPVRLVLDASKHPTVAWSAGSSSVYLRSWNGSAWVELGGSDTAGGISGATSGDSPALALGPTGLPTVAWQLNNGGAYGVYLKQWSGTAWVELGGSGSGTGLATQSAPQKPPNVALDSNGYPTVFWSQYPSGMYLKHWTGSAWTELGGSASGGGIGTAAYISKAAVVLDSSGNPTVAWTAGPVFVKRWNGTSWVELAGSGSGLGISGSTGGGGLEPELALDAAGNPIVAWTGLPPSGQEEVYVRRWDGTQWVDLGVHSSTGGGVSNAAGQSFRPSMVRRGGFVGVAWEDWGEGGFDICFRRIAAP
jgi:hypothetical protein